MVLCVEKPRKRFNIIQNIHFYINNWPGRKQYLKQICGYCESTLKQINNRTFQIKNAIEWKKFTMGSM